MLQQEELLAALGRRNKEQPPQPSPPSPSSNAPHHPPVVRLQDAPLIWVAEQPAAETVNGAMNEAVKEAGAGEGGADNTVDKAAENAPHEVSQPLPLSMHLSVRPFF